MTSVSLTHQISLEFSLLWLFHSHQPKMEWFTLLRVLLNQVCR